jgi:hypothetical protein
MKRPARLAGPAPSDGLLVVEKVLTAAMSRCQAAADAATTGAADAATTGKVSPTASASVGHTFFVGLKTFLLELFFIFIDRRRIMHSLADLASLDVTGIGS